MGDVVDGEGVFEFGVLEESGDALAVFELAFQVFVDLVGELGGDEALAVVIPLGVDADQEVSFFPVDGVAEDVAFAGAGGVEPEAQEAVLPDGGSGVVGAGDEAGVGGADGLAIEGLADPDFAVAAVVEADVGVFAVEFFGAEFGGDAWAGGLGGTLAEAEHGARGYVRDWI